jgi:hypothetical protein
MSQPTDPKLPTEPPPLPPSLLERYGTAAVVTILVLFAVEMAVLVPLLRYGVDVTPLTAWIARTFGVDVGPAAGEPVSWWVALGVAYAITRAIKPLQLALAAGLTPITARLLDR